MSTVRVQGVRGKDAWSVRHPDGYRVTLIPGDAYDEDDALVEMHEWAFLSDVETDAGIEQATANPGERRTTRRL